MPTEQLQLGTDDAVLGQVGDELMAKEMRIDPLRDARGPCILRDQLAQSPGRVRTVPPRLKEIGRALTALASTPNSDAFYSFPLLRISSFPLFPFLFLVHILR